MWRVASSAKDPGVVAKVAFAFDTFVDALTVTEPDRNGVCNIEGFCLEEPNQRNIENILKICEVPALDLTVEEVEETDWLAKNQESFQPIDIGRFFIYPSHFEGALPENKLCLQIDAGRAFGSGEHATTKGCLVALETLRTNLPKDQQPRRIYDLGCGTAILSMAAATLFETDVIAADIDPNAVACASQNLGKNGYLRQIQTLISNGCDHPEIQANRPFDLIIANVLAGPLIEMAHQIKSHVAPGGHIILSGFTLDQEEMVIGAYNTCERTQTIRMEDWCTVTLKTGA